MNASLSAELPGKPTGSFLHSVVMSGAGLAGAYVSWKLINVIGPVFTLPPDLAGLAFGAAPPPEVAARVRGATFFMNLKNAALWMSVSGAVFGTLFGASLLALKRLRHSFIRLIPATVVAGTISGALAGCVSICVDSLVRMKMDPGAVTPPEQFVLLTHSLTWLTAGFGIGIGIWFGMAMTLRKGLECTASVGLTAMLGGCLYPIIAGLMFPAVNSAFPIPHSEPSEARLIWLSLPGLMMGLAAGRRE